MTLEELLRQGKSFGQGASNAAASTVTGPVDMLAWLLRKGGVDVGDTPIGGEAWMRQKGLMATPENRLAGLLGEGAGLAAPIVAAAKAPEIAGGLLQMGRNLAAPQTMNKQTGAIVYHGSPHKFDKFDSSKIGTGEGAQAYGHGMYLAENPSVAQGYADRLGGGQFGSTSASKGSIADRLSSIFGGDGSNFTRNNRDISTLAKSMAEKSRTDADGLLHYQFKDGSEWIGSPSGWDVANSEKHLYKVDLPDEHIAKMLDYDNPVTDAVRKPLSKAALNQFGSGLTGTSGEKLYKEMIFNFKQAGHPNPTQAATDWLSSQGVPGMRYLDGGSRSNGAGTSNFVIFPKNEGLLQILERNGQAVGK
jgi:hypothetical protein